MPVPPPRVVATEAALRAIGRLRDERGPVVIFQSGGCCDGSIPLCFRKGELPVSPGDVLLGEPGGCPVYIDARQFAVVRDSQLVLDVAPGDPEGFSLPAGEQEHFVVTSRRFTEDELAALAS
jgi:uncharacterized protein